MAASHFDHLTSLLDPTEVISSAHPLYTTESQPWAIQKDRKPSLVIRPKTVQSLSRAVAYLSSSDLEFAVRSQGFGSASAKDVLISLTAFDDFSFDREKEVVTLGAGQNWGDYYGKMEQEAPGWTVVACRTPCIGVGGSILCGGFSWLSGEYGCVSDPENMLDAQVVKLDGSIIWASEEPELFWALRGTGGGFGVVTAFKLRAIRYTQSIWAGPILLPRGTLEGESLRRVAKDIAAMANRKTEPKVAMFLYVMKEELLQAIGATSDMLVVHAFDALGEEHGRSEAAFKWALETPGAVDSTKVMNLRGVADMQAHIGEMKGKTYSYWSPVALSELTEDNILRAFEWHDKVLATGGSVRDSGYLLFELKCMSDAKSGPSATAWPRPKGAHHIMLFGAGCASDAEAWEDEAAQKLVEQAPTEVLGQGAKVDNVPNALEHFHDVSKVYREHYPKLQELKRKYDPGDKLKGPIRPQAVTDI